MSGIFGALALDGGEPSPSHLQPMAAQLARRAPDGTHFWNDGPVALGHALLATTPEALVESLPLTDPESGCTITADARLDNREALMAELGLDGGGRVVGDGELILRAFLRWDEDCPKHLLGDFAFAIWDPRSQRLFCARDHMGMRQLIYHHDPGRLFAFATDVRAVLAFPGVPRRINETRIADFLDDLEGIDLTSTFFENVFRLPPAHSLEIGGSGIEIRRYWELTLPPELNLPSEEAYADAFREVLTEAVRCRLRSAGPVGAMLSGGLDSSSVAAIAAELQDGGGLNTFSAIGPNAQTCPETRAIQSALSNGQFNSTTVDYAKLGEYRTDLIRAVEDIDDPFDAHMNLVRAMYIAARRAGVNVVLDGVGGDLAMTSGNRIAQHLRRRQFGEALAEANGTAQFWRTGATPIYLFIAAAWTAFAPPPLRRFKQRLQHWWADHRAMKGKSGVTPTFAKRSGLAARRRRYRRHLRDACVVERSYQLLSISHPHTAAGRERYDRISSRFAVESRDPFMDIRLLRFCLSLPREQLTSNGWTKLVMRRAMGTLLPENVAWRQGKDHLGLHFTKAMIAGADTWPRRWLAMRERVATMSSHTAKGTSSSAVAAEIGSDNFIDLFSLGCWLSRHDVPREKHNAEEK